MGHLYPVDSDLDPVDIVAWWAEQAKGPRNVKEPRRDDNEHDGASRPEQADHE